MIVCEGLVGEKYYIGDQISESTGGAEGSICSVLGNDELVAKIYHKQIIEDRSDELEQRLKILVRKEVLEKIGVFSIAWPKDILYTTEGGIKRIIGYTMRKIEAKYSLYNLIRRENCKSKIIRQYSWRHLIQSAYNLSWFVNYLHSKGIILGDFNEKNFMFDDNTGGFSLIDCGAYGIYDGTLYIPNLYTMPTYCAPEKIEGITVDDPRYTDYFYLAILIFNLLTNNSNPFRTIPISNDDDGWYHAIRNGDCAYVKELKGKSIPGNAVRPGIFPDDILEAFNRSFNYSRNTIKSSINKRVTAYEWCMLLDTYLKDSSKLVQCLNNKEHIYSSHLLKCPWCYPESVSKLSYEKKQMEYKACAVLAESLTRGWGPNDDIVYYHYDYDTNEIIFSGEGLKRIGKFFYIDDLKDDSYKRLVNTTKEILLEFQMNCNLLVNMIMRGWKYDNCNIYFTYDNNKRDIIFTSEGINLITNISRVKNKKVKYGYTEYNAICRMLKNVLLDKIRQN